MKSCPRSHRAEVTTYVLRLADKWGRSPTDQLGLADKPPMTSSTSRPRFVVVGHLLFLRRVSG